MAARVIQFLSLKSEDASLRIDEYRFEFVATTFT